MFRLVAIAMVLASIAAPTAASYETTIRIDLSQGQSPIHAAPPGMVALSHATHDSWAWDLFLQENYTIAEIRATGFNLSRPQQLLPEYNDSSQHSTADHLHPHFFAEVHRNVSDVEAPARIVNFTKENATLLVRLGLTGPGRATLHLTRDVTAPRFTVGLPSGIEHYRFLLETTTDEFAYGDVRIRPFAGGAEVPNPTPVPLTLVMVALFAL